MNVNKISELLAEFWQSSSDACPLECGEAEKQENEFNKFINAYKEHRKVSEILEI